MADFLKAFDKVVAKEGGYVNNPNDAGGETFMGICRKYYPSLHMWEVIDDIKNKLGVKQVNNKAKANKEVVSDVKNIYKSKYWNALQLDEVKSQRIAQLIFDDGVNRGIVAAIKTAQKVVGMKQTGRMSKELIVKLTSYGKSK